VDDIRPVCPACGYDLTGQVADEPRDLDREIVCSECGRRMRVSEAMAAGSGFVRPVRVAGWLLISALGMAVLGTLWIVAKLARLL
jgi:hypothetical protein